MIWLWLGVLIWSGVHVMPSLAPAARTSLIERFGDKGYRIGFALVVFGSILFMVLGWRSATADIIYEPLAIGRHLAMLFVLAAFILFGLAHGPSNVKRFVRHPQLTGLVLWAIGHLLANGDSRSVVLFGVLGIWALIEMFLLDRRDGKPALPEVRPWSAEIKPVAIGVAVYVVFVLLHPFLFGVSPMGT